MNHSSISRCLCSFLVLMLCSTAFSQVHRFPPINSGILLDSADRLEEAQAYDKVQALLSTIPANDTNYVEALYKKAYAFMLADAYDSCIKVASQGIRIAPESKQRFMHLMASSYDYADSATQALATLQQLLTDNPEYLPGKYSRSIILRKQKKIAEAKQELQEILLANPYYINAHFSLGEICFEEGNMVAAMLALQAYLVLAADGKYTSNTIDYFDKMVTLPEEVRKKAAAFRFSKVPAFNEIQQVLLSKAALNPKYKLQLSFNDKIVRQIQACNELLEYDPGNNDFVMQYYVPFFSANFKEGYFDAMIYDMFRALEISEIQSWVKKNTKKLDAYTDRVNAYMGLIRTSRTLMAEKRSQAGTCYLYESGVLVGKGPCTDANLALYYGPWKFFNPTGVLRSEGNFDKQQKKQGEWKYYHDNGVLKEKSQLKDDKLQGPSITWFNNGMLSMDIFYENDVQQREEKLYFYNGVLRQKVMYLNGEMEGIREAYNYKAQLTETNTFKAGKLQGLTLSFYDNGRVKDSLTYADGKPQGTHYKFSKDGILLEKGDYLDGKRHGLWLTWYPDGTTLREKTQYDMGDITGPFLEYYDNGVISRKGTYVKKKPDGLIEDFAKDGILFSTILMDKGKLRQIRYLDKQGKEIQSFNTSRSPVTVSFYNSQGIKTSEGAYTREGDRQGKYTDFYPSGKVKETKNYKNGMLEGVVESFFVTGKKEYEGLYKNDELWGYNKWYHSNGQLRSEGWYEDGTKAQFMSFYSELGTQSDLDYYLRDDKNGPQISYHPNGQVAYITRYKDGWIQGLEQYDSTGKALMKADLTGGKGKVQYMNTSGTQSVTLSFDHFEMQGPYTRYFPDGPVMSKQNMLFSDLHGPSVWYYSNGKVSVENTYKFGQKQGERKEYFLDGQLREIEYFKDDELEGENKLYRSDGTLQKVDFWKSGERNGPSTYYDGAGKPIFAIIYDMGDVKAIATQPRGEKLMDTIPVVKGSGTFEIKDAAGNKVADFTLLDHLLHGPFALYHANGKPMWTSHYDAGYQHGTRTRYFANGTVWQRDYYIAGRRFGKSELYYASGKPALVEHLSADALHGTCTYYEPSGKVIASYFFYNGIPEQKIQ